MFVGPNLWNSNYKARTELSTVEYILASNFDDIFISDLKESFENCLRTDSGNTLRSPFNFYNFRGINLANPINDNDAANSGWVNDQIYKFEAIKNEENPVTGDYPLGNGVNSGIYQYSMVQGGDINFILAEPANKNVMNQIMIDIKTDDIGSSIDFGTELFFNKTRPLFAPNNTYTIIYEFSNVNDSWIVGMILKGQEL